MGRAFDACHGVAQHGGTNARYEADEDEDQETGKLPTTSAEQYRLSGCSPCTALPRGHDLRGTYPACRLENRRELEHTGSGNIVDCQRDRAEHGNRLCVKEWHA